jgi:hypothetical protein
LLFRLHFKGCHPSSSKVQKRKGGDERMTAVKALQGPTWTEEDKRHHRAWLKKTLAEVLRGNFAPKHFDYLVLDCVEGLRDELIEWCDNKAS